MGTIILGAVYSPYCNNINYISKQEYKARKWAYSTLIPFKILIKKISQGLNIYELSEYFDVTIQYMKNCIDFYNNKYGIFIYN